MNFLNRHAIITGGSSGIGKATAKLLAKKGANISIIARDRAKLDLAQQEIEAVRLNSNQRVIALVADVANQSENEAAITQAIAQLDNPDILITSAGMAYPGYFAEIPPEIFIQTMAVNYFGSLYSVQAILPAMEKQRQGNIVLISSGAGLIGLYGYSAYSPSKFALRGLAESLRGELKPQGITVAIVYPPDTDTPQLKEENKTKPLETKKITASAETWTAEGVAQAIVRGIERNSFAIAPGWEMSILQRWHSVLTPLLNWYFDRLIRHD